MGSYSLSNTAYTNKPQTVTDNGLALDGEGNALGSNFSFGGKNGSGGVGGNATINFTDGGAIASAFGFGADVVKGLFQAQKETNALISSTNSAANGLVNKTQELVDKKENLPANTLIQGSKTLWVLGAVVAAYFVYKGRK